MGHAVALRGRSVKSLTDWPLQASLPETASAATFDPSQTWTIAAAGDVMLDRGVYKVVKLQGKGVDFPFSGGNATITSRYCCSSWDWVMPRTKVDDTTQDMRALTSGAEPVDGEPGRPRAGQRLLPRHGNDLQLQPGPSCRAPVRRHRLGLAGEQPHPQRRQAGRRPDDHGAG